MKKAFKILLILLPAAALAFGGLTLVLRSSMKESVTPLVKHYAENPSPAWSKIWLKLYGYEITYADQVSVSFGNDYWNGTASNTGVVLTHGSWLSSNNIEAEAGAVIGDLEELCGAYHTIGNGIAFHYGSKLIYVTLPSEMFPSVTVSILVNPSAFK